MDIYLDRLEMHGFKSFPEKTVIKFHRGITAVVGPNGCGKSNIVDAVLWVLGEQKIKNLRGENNEDLIFSGSSSKKPLGMTEVGAFFQNSRDEVYIARRFFRTGESKYILNEKYCRNKDIQDELFKMYLGDRSYFIFEQGSIEKLVSLKPSEKRMLIEEAAGISQYLVRKKETANKLIIAQQNLDNIEVLILDKESRLRELKNQVNFVQRYRRIKNERSDLLKAFLKKKSDRFQEDFRHQKAEAEKIMSQETAAVKAISGIEKEILTLEDKRWAIDKELKQNQQEIFDFNKQIISAKNDIASGRQRKGFMEQKSRELKDAAARNRQEIEQLEKQLAGSGSDLEELESQLKKENSRHEALKTKLANLAEQSAAVESENADLKNDIFNAQREMTTVGNQVKELEKGISRTENEILSKKNFAAELRKQADADEIEKSSARLRALREEYDEKKSRFEASEEEHRQSRILVEELQTGLKNLENEIKNLENQKAKYLEIKKKIVGEEAKATDIRHHGLLQELIQADRKNHKILENFYHDEMDALMVEQTEHILSGNFAKALLKREQVDQMPPGIEQEEGFIAFVKDLFGLKEPALKAYLKDGILVDNLKSGIRLFVKYGLDVVTQAAETISGHGLLVRSREKGILDVIEEIRSIDAQKAALLEESQAVKEALARESEKESDLAKKIAQERTGLNAKEKELIQLESELEALQKNCETALKRVEMTESESELLAAEKEKLQAEFALLEQKNNQLEKDYRALEQKRESFQGQLQRLKEEINRVEKEFLQQESTINLVKEKIHSCRHNRKVLSENIARLQKSIDQDEQEIVRLKNSIAEIDRNEKRLEDDLAAMTKRKDELEGLAKTREQEFAALNEEVKEQSAVLSSKRKQLEELKEKKKEFEIALSAIKKDLFQLEELCFKELNCELANVSAEGLDELANLDIAQLQEQIDALETRLAKMRDSNRLNFSAESEFEILGKDYNFQLSQKEDVVKSIQDMNDAIAKIDEESRVGFLEAFEKVKENFLRNFRILFDGGEADLALLDDENVLEAGLEIKAQPPGKRLTGLKLLSGGEKTLTALAFLFSLFEYKPSPFCVFDEVDAALDEANIQRFLKFVHKLKEKTQFLVITHNFKTMEEADYIYGISMNEPGVSTIYSMKMTGSEKLARG